jgi:hypothetical protein
LHAVEGRVYWRGAAVLLEEVLRAEKTERLAIIRQWVCALVTSVAYSLLLLLGYGASRYWVQNLRPREYTITRNLGKITHSNVFVRFARWSYCCLTSSPSSTLKLRNTSWVNSTYSPLPPLCSLLPYCEAVDQSHNCCAKSRKGRGSVGTLILHVATSFTTILSAGTFRYAAWIAEVLPTAAAAVREFVACLCR